MSEFYPDFEHSCKVTLLTELGEKINGIGQIDRGKEARLRQDV